MLPAKIREIHVSIRRTGIRFVVIQVLSIIFTVLTSGSILINIGNENVISNRNSRVVEINVDNEE